MSFNTLKTVFLFSLLFNLYCCLFNLSHAATLDTKLSRDKIALGETVNILFNLSNATTDMLPDFSPLEKDFRIVGTHHSIAINILNGVTHGQTLWQVTVEPKKAGELWIPEINFGNVKSSPRQLWVEEAASSVQSDPKNAPAFVQAEVSTTTPYVQSQILYTFKLFYRTQLENPSIEPPHIENGTLTQVGEDKFYQTTLHGEQFLVFEKNFAIFPQKTGKLIIPPTHFRAFQFELNARWMNDPFSVMSTNEPITLATQAFTLNVQKIPASFQGNIWLPAKNISLTEKWSADPNQWETGNPITRTITIEAQGLRADQIPDLTMDTISGVNIYADPPHRSNTLQGNTVLGKWQQKITYIPNRSQSFTIPALQLNWWNTQTNANATAQLKSIAVQVHGKMNDAGSASANAVPLVTVEESKPATDLLPQNSTSGSLQQKNNLVNASDSFYQSIWFWIAVVMLMMWLITLWRWKMTTAKKSDLNTVPVKKDQSVINTKSGSDKTFAQACEERDIVLVQKMMLSWAESQWQDPPRNLGKLGELIHDENFKKALGNLEQALYADEVIQWNGKAFLAAYEKVQKDTLKTVKKKRVAKHQPLDPLPPLYP